MKQYFSLFLLLFFLQQAFAQRDTILINGIKFFTTKQVIKTEYEKKDTLLKLYRLDNGRAKYLLQHYLYRYGLDAENEFKDIGSMEIHSDSIILKTHYFQKRSDPIPEWRKQIYRVTASGKLLLLYNRCKQRNSSKWQKIC